MRTYSFLLRDVHAPIERVVDPELEAAGMDLYIKREDLIHSEISGNKWRKLKYNGLQALATPDCRGLATFGGAFSNHIAATAAIGALLKIETLGIIRGESRVRYESCST